MSKRWQITVSVVVGFFFISLLNWVRSEEHLSVLRSLKSFEPSAACEIDLDLDRSIFLFGGASSYEVTLTSGEEIYSTRVSRHFEPTRMVKNRSKLFQYEWSTANDSGAIIWSYLKTEIDWEGNAEWVEIGACSDYPEEVRYSGYPFESCMNEHQAIKCT